MGGIPRVSRVFKLEVKLSRKIVNKEPIVVAKGRARAVMWRCNSFAISASGVADLEAESVDSGTSRHNGPDAARSELAKTERRVRTSGVMPCQRGAGAW